MTHIEDYNSDDRNVGVGENWKKRFARISYNQTESKFDIEFDRPFDYKVFEKLIVMNSTDLEFYLDDEHNVVGLGIALIEEEKEDLEGDNNNNV